MKALMIACTLGIVATAEAQVNIELYRGKPGIAGKVNVHSGGATGNSEFFDGGASANISYTTGTYSLLFVGRGLLGFASGERFSNEGLGHLRYTWIEPRRFQLEIFAQSDYAAPRQLDSRVLFGSGLRTVIHNQEALALSVGNSLMWEYERIDVPAFARHPDGTSVIRSSNYVNLQAARGDATARFTGYVQFDIREPSDARLLGDIEVSTTLIGPLDQTTSLRYRLDTEPPDGVEKNDLHIGASLGLNF